GALRGRQVGAARPHRGAGAGGRALRHQGQPARAGPPRRRLLARPAAAPHRRVPRPDRGGPAGNRGGDGEAGSVPRLGGQQLHERRQGRRGRRRMKGPAMRDQAREIFRDGFEEFQQFVNPLIAQRARLAGEPIRFARVADGLLVDADGRAYEDFHGTQMLGHRNAAVAEALREFLDSDAPNWFPSRVNPWAGRLGRRLCERTGYSNVYFGMTGADAVEAALKLARAATGKPRILGLQGAYHGCSFGAVALMHEGPLHDPFGPHLPGAERLPFGDAGALARALAPGDVCAVVVEPIQGEGGVRALPADYVNALCELTERHGALLVADEVQTSLGRCGALLASRSWPRQPDVALIAKALGGGLMPISA